jgi:Leucine-rich repeat (LRR) protein
MPLLSKFVNLTELSLHGNRLKSLPQDLSVLENLEILDISNNLIQDVNSYYIRIS